MYNSEHKKWFCVLLLLLLCTTTTNYHYHYLMLFLGHVTNLLLNIINNMLSTRGDMNTIRNSILYLVVGKDGVVVESQGKYVATILNEYKLHSCKYIELLIYLYCT